MAGNKVYVQGHYVDVHDNEVVNISIDKVGTMQVDRKDVYYGKEMDFDSDNAIPEVLRTEPAKVLLSKAVSEGWLDERWQPEVSSTEAALLAMRVAECLNIKTVWKVFGALWHRNSESLRAKYNMGMEQEKTREFMGQLHRVLK